MNLCLNRQRGQANQKSRAAEKSKEKELQKLWIQANLDKLLISWIEAQPMVVNSKYIQIVVNFPQVQCPLTEKLKTSTLLLFKLLTIITLDLLQVSMITVVKFNSEAVEIQ